MGKQSYMRSVVERNVVMQRTSVHESKSYTHFQLFISTIIVKF